MDNPQAFSAIRTSPAAEPRRAEKLGRLKKDPGVDETAAILRAGGREGGRDRSGQPCLAPGTAPARNLRPDPSSPAARAGHAPLSVDQRRRLERDLHDGVQNELVALLVGLGMASEDPDTPRALAATLASLAGHAIAALESLREIAHGMTPRLLAKFGLREALCAQAARAAVDVTVTGGAPRSSKEAEEAVYFSCLEAIQNAAKHAGRSPRVELRLRHGDGMLRVRIADNGVGFDPARTTVEAGLRNIRDRVQDLDGTFSVASKPGGGTVLMLTLPWPTRPARGR